MKRHAIAALALAVLTAWLPEPAHAAAQTIRVGVSSGAQAEIMNEVRRVAATEGLALDVVVFDQPSRIDAALVAKQIDVASFEDEPALDAQRKLHGYALTSVATTVTFPVALYSRKLTSLVQLQRGSTIAVPDDPAGTARALILRNNFV